MKNNSAFISVRKEGLYCSAGDFYLDPRKPVEHAVISHAHGDHATPHSKNVYATTPTITLMNRRFGDSLFTTSQARKYKDPFVLGDVQLTFFPAGHMLGSAQVLMEHEEKRYLYTGDFKTQADDSCEAFEFISCDELITETTFADPAYSHPDPGTALEVLFEREGHILIGAYALGKAQRVTRLVSSLFPQRPLFVHPRLTSYHRIYEQFGFTLGNWKIYTRPEFLSHSNAVLIVPPDQFIRHSRNRSAYKVFATGWKKSFYRCDDVLPLSDHADWNGVLELIKRSGARVVHTVHGNGAPLQSHFSGSDIQVHSLR